MNYHESLRQWNVARFKHRTFDWQYIHCIHVKQPHEKSYAAFIKYLRWLASLEMMTNSDRWMQFRYTYLIEKQQEGALTCVYCNKTDLHIYSPDESILATVDHIHPLSRGGDRYDKNNLCIACSRCNQKKQSKFPLNFFWEYQPWCNVQQNKQKETQCTLRPTSALAVTI
jgi:5-methylcytosine-specific restriction endonuclease McrA